MARPQKSYCTDGKGHITQANYTEKRSDGKIETRHYNSNTTESQGKTVHDGKGGSEFFEH